MGPWRSRHSILFLIIATISASAPLVAATGIIRPSEQNLWKGCTATVLRGLLGARSCVPVDCIEVYVLPLPCELTERIPIGDTQRISSQYLLHSHPRCCSEVFLLSKLCMVWERLIMLFINSEVSCTLAPCLLVRMQLWLFQYNSQCLFIDRLLSWLESHWGCLRGANLLLHPSSNASRINAGPHEGMIVLCKDKNAKWG